MNLNLERLGISTWNFAHLSIMYMATRTSKCFFFYFSLRYDLSKLNKTGKLFLDHHSACAKKKWHFSSLPTALNRKIEEATTKIWRKQLQALALQNSFDHYPLTTMRKCSPPTFVLWWTSPMPTCRSHPEVDGRVTSTSAKISPNLEKSWEKMQKWFEHLKTWTYFYVLWTGISLAICRTRKPL